MNVKQGREKTLILVKALPHIGDKHGETVCCAGVTENGSWRRLFPVVFRSLETEKQFKRWQWVEYDWRVPRDDRRPESRRIQENSINILREIPKNERPGFLNPCVVPTPERAEKGGKTLVLVRPVDSHFHWKPKPTETIEDERQAFERAARQYSFFSSGRKKWEPCPFSFHFSYRLVDGKIRNATCDDWETAATFYKYRKKYGESEALRVMDERFNQDYPKNGMVFAMGTHSRFPNTWLLVGVIRLDPLNQLSLI